MARICEAEIARIKKEVSTVRLVEAYGVELKPHGKDLVGHCPFHNDKTPSLVVSPASNLWNCLGACNAGGSPIDWIMKTQGVSFRHAVEILREGSAPDPGSNAVKPPKRTTVQKLPAPVETDAEDAELLLQVVDFYHETLKESPDALEYLASRGLNSPELIDRFKLGFANRTLGYRLPQKNRKEGQLIRERLQNLGILRESGHEHFNGSLVIPIFDEHGRVVEVYGRKITPKLRKGTALHLYLPGPHRGVWNVEALAASKEIILCEALIDALTFWNAGFRNVTASYGVNGFTEEHFDAFKKHGTKRVLIAFDRDEAGEKAAEVLSGKLQAKGIDCYRIQFPKGMDANEYALKVRPAAKSLEILIRKALWLGNGKPPPLSVPVASTPVKNEKQAAKKEKDENIIFDEDKTASSLAADSSAADPQPSSLPPLPPLSATPIPKAPKPEIPAEVNQNEIIINLGDRRWRIRGMSKNMSYDVLKVNLLVSRGEALHVDAFNLYAARQRAAFISQAAGELGVKDDVIKKDLGKVLLKLEELQDRQIREALEPKEPAIMMSDSEKAEALKLLKSPDLLKTISADFEASGLVGEEVNKQVGYLAAVSRRLEKPLAVMVQSSSAAGKSTLMDAVLAFTPEEERVQYSAMTGQSLYYMGETNLKHKILAIAEEEGAERASYALKLLQSEGKLSIASTGKDPASGKLITHEYNVEGPVAIMLSTTAIDLDEELLNRCIVLTVDESREQTRAIHKMQRESDTLQGWRRKRKKEALLKLHRNAQRLLAPLKVIMPFADSLTFPDSCTRTRRDHEKYLALIRSIALLHQHQRPVKTDGGRNYIEATLEDIAFANKIAGEVLGRTLDELPPQTRRLLELVETMVKEDCGKQQIERAHFWFSRRKLRERCGWGNTQLKVHLSRLVEMEYLVVHRGGGQSFLYELVYDGGGKNGKPFLPGLIDVDKLNVKHGCDVNRSGQNEKRSPPGRPLVGGVSGGGRTSAKPLTTDDSGGFGDDLPKNAYMPPPINLPSYPQPNHSSMRLSPPEAD